MMKNSLKDRLYLILLQEEIKIKLKNWCSRKNNASRL